MQNLFFFATNMFQNMIENIIQTEGMLQKVLEIDINCQQKKTTSTQLEDIIIATELVRDC